ncbi:MAG: aldehyde dehydrogenase family protein, partial [Gemmatimonadota bacterium]
MTTTSLGTTGSDLAALLTAQRAAFLREGPPSLQERRTDLANLSGAIVTRREQFIKAISDDFGHRSRHETTLLDLGSTLEGIRYLRHHLARWMRPERRGVAIQFQPGSNRVCYQPLGVIGVISPWNYPAALAVMPLATALAAGNRVMLKPSEITSRTSALLREMLAELFGPAQVAVVIGDAKVGAEFAGLPFDHLLFTGSTPVGRAVLRAASDNLVPVTLELGGKSPAIVERGSSIEVAARRIAFGKLANGGQTCVAPDYALVADEEIDPFVTEYTRQVGILYPDIQANLDYSTIVNQRHFDRLHGLLADARAQGARIVELGQLAAGQPATHPRTFPPVVVLGATSAMKVMQEEIFGPILPVVGYQRLEEAVAFVNDRPRPLALYFFGPDGP